ncbi:hypothetical protein AVEN_25650-1 [Araneus ventricosus]|uniref:Uncharacterized protein n=1 Tax=Araneus ventricosus TaxID=182803 RepID=A0A4Y2BNZ2_ARAVE|nr:hypothetical protein AVEN_25650-1 [Araneus ventricosus]
MKKKRNIKKEKNTLKEIARIFCVVDGSNAYHIVWILYQRFCGQEHLGGHLLPLPLLPLPLSLQFQRISFVVHKKILHVNDLPKLSLFHHRLDLLAYGPDWTDNHKWSFEHW